MRLKRLAAAAAFALSLSGGVAFGYPDCGTSNNQYNPTGVGGDYNLTLTNFDSIANALHMTPVAGMNTGHGTAIFDTVHECPSRNQFGMELGPKNGGASVTLGTLPGHILACRLTTPPPDPCYGGVCMNDIGIIFNNYKLLNTAPNIGVVSLTNGVSYWSPEPSGEADCPDYLRGETPLAMHSSCFRAPNGACSPVAGPPNSDLTWVANPGQFNVGNVHGGAGGALQAP